MELRGRKRDKRKERGGEGGAEGDGGDYGSLGCTPTQWALNHIKQSMSA